MHQHKIAIRSLSIIKNQTVMKKQWKTPQQRYLHSIQ